MTKPTDQPDAWCAKCQAVTRREGRNRCVPCNRAWQRARRARLVTSRPCDDCGALVTERNPSGLFPLKCVDCRGAFRERMKQRAWCDDCARDTLRTGRGECRPCKHRAFPCYVGARHDPLPAKPCSVCGDPFVPRRRVRNFTCGPTCAAEHKRREDLRWAREHPENTRANGSRYRARKRAALVHDVSEEMVWEFNPAGPGCCNYCRAPLAFEDRKAWHIDHVVPLVRGGLHEVSNLVISCVRCNLSKKDKLLSEWRGPSRAA